MSMDKFITHKGQTMSIAEWARVIGIKHKTIHMRLKMGWTVERALERHIQKGFLLNEKRIGGVRDAEIHRLEEKKQIREWLRTQPAEIEERREEGEIL